MKKSFNKKWTFLTLFTFLEFGLIHLHGLVLLNCSVVRFYLSCKTPNNAFTFFFSFLNIFCLAHSMLLMPFFSLAMLLVNLECLTI